MEKHEIPSLEWLSDHINDPEYDQFFETLLNETEVNRQDESITRVKANINACINDSGKVYTKKIRRLRIFSSAAVILALFGLATSFFNVQQTAEWLESYAAVGEIRNVELPDGTKICLNSDTRLIYPSRFDRDNRKIYVDGEIYADVVSDEKRPFIIESRNLSVRVLGTRLRVKSYMDDANAEVALISGKVEVTAGDGSEATDRVLQPGQMIRYNREINTIEDYKVDYTLGFWNYEHNIKFVNESLEDISADLERRFGVDIIIEGKTLANTQYYASFVNGESLESILNTLNSNGSMKISKLNDAYIITNSR